MELTGTMVAPRGRIAHLVFMGAFAALGWGVLLAATYQPGFGPGVVRSEGVLSFATFFIVIVVARRMAMPLLPRTVVSLDSALFVAAGICLGSVIAGRLVALALTLDALFRLVGPDGNTSRRERGGTWVDDLLYVLYFGGMSGALVMVISWLFEADAFFPVPVADLEWRVVGLVFGIGVAFLASHYALQGARLRLLGNSLPRFVRRMALPGMLAEASLLPLAVVVVLIYKPDQPLPFMLLGATYVVINYLFSRLTDTGNKLRSRVKELETLNHSARELASSLQLHELVESVARETVRAIPEAELVTLVRREGERLVVDSYDAQRRAFERFVAQDEGPSGWVLQQGRTLSIADLRLSDSSPAGDHGVRSWLGVPLAVYGDTEGVLAVQSREPRAFLPDHRRVLEALGAQAAVALQNAQLYELAMVDGLTRLFVRRYFDARLREEIERSRRFGSEFSVVMMDIDDFKQLNDTYGHQAGDEVLIAVAETVRRQMRGVDTAARYGGEEFAVVLPRTGMLDAYNQAERIRDLIEELRISTAGGMLRVRASFGIAAYPESGGGDAADVVRRADTALYRAKKTGKNRVELYWAEGKEGGIPSLRTV